VVHDEVNDGNNESVFLCPSFMNESLLYVCPVMSLDATHLKSKHKGVMYLSTVKTGLNEIYTVAISIEQRNEGYNVWKQFLSNLKIACSNLEISHPLQAHNGQAYYTFILDRDKGLVQALKEIFSADHTTQCNIHIQWNVLTKFHSSQVAFDITKIARTFSSYQEKIVSQCSKTI
jgi:transposase-like protein